jgi:hypothetical protein
MCRQAGHVRASGDSKSVNRCDKGTIDAVDDSDQLIKNERKWGYGCD